MDSKRISHVCTKCELCINRIELFENLSDLEQLGVMSRASHEVVPKGTVIFRPDEPSDKLFIIRKGKLKLSNYDENGKEFIYEILTDGKIFGEESIFSGKNFGMYGEAITELHICILSKETLEELFKKDWDFTIKFVNALGKKLSEGRENIRLLSIDDTKERVEQFLVSRCEHLGTNQIELTRDNIAAAINLSRETVSRKLNEIAKDGNIELVGYKKIIVKNIEKLKRI